MKVLQKTIKQKDLFNVAMDKARIMLDPKSFETIQKEIEHKEWFIQQLETDLKALRSRKSTVDNLNEQIKKLEHDVHQLQIQNTSIKNTIRNITQEREHWKKQFFILQQKGSSQ